MKRRWVYEPAVYAIRRIGKRAMYVGSSLYVSRRWAEHQRCLNSGKHSCGRLQRVWKRFGSAAFEFVILESLEPNRKLLQEREQFYLDTCLGLYNTSRSATGIDLEWTPEQRAHAAEMSRRRKGEPVSEKKKLASRASAAIARQFSAANKPGWIPKHRIGVKDSADTVAKRRESTLKTFAAQREAGIRFIWITDGATERKIISTDPIADGWRRGRIPKIGEVGRSRIGEKRSAEARANMSRAHIGKSFVPTPEWWEAHAAAMKRTAPERCRKAQETKRRRAAQQELSL